MHQLDSQDSLGLVPDFCYGAKGPCSDVSWKVQGEYDSGVITE